MAKSKRARELRAEAAARRFQTTSKKEEESETESEEDEEEETEEIVQYVSCNRVVANRSTKPEDEDEEAMRHMVEEMKGLRCGTNTDNAYGLDDTASEESDAGKDSKVDQSERPIPTETRAKELTFRDVQERGSGEKESSPSAVTCNVCTTIPLPPLPICCETCNNVLQPEKLSKDKVWKCTAPGCDGLSLGYVNFQDAGRCGLCGSKH